MGDGGGGAGCCSSDSDAWLGSGDTAPKCNNVKGDESQWFFILRVSIIRKRSYGMHLSLEFVMRSADASAAEDAINHRIDAAIGARKEKEPLLDSL